MDEKPTAQEPCQDKVERARRARVLLGGIAAFNQEHSAVPCLVRDLSETGARVEFDLGWIVPANFTLFIDLEGFKVECEKVWHEGKLYGVRFIGPRISTDRARRQHIDLFEPSATPDTPCATTPETTATPRSKPTRPTFGKFR